MVQDASIEMEGPTELYRRCLPDLIRVPRVIRGGKCTPNSVRQSLSSSRRISGVMSPDKPTTESLSPEIDEALGVLENPFGFFA